MRFVKLALERYGHFDNCTLSFRSGEPDLHVVDGGNEAGKTTSLAAVSDLLFGFPGRSPYNFMYDYSLLRVGAVLEDEGRTTACRRKKATSGTLLGVSDELARLKEEADAIWDPRASSKRLFTVAQRELETNARAIRERSLRPKTWLDGKAAVATAQAALEDARARRDELLTEISRADTADRPLGTSSEGPSGGTGRIQRHRRYPGPARRHGRGRDGRRGSRDEGEGCCR
jgi:hypothetical protein